MDCVGIIAEYNPFHNGHAIHIEKSKTISKSQFAIVVMSGNFVQRGTPAIVDKYLRTKMALLNGADIVLELPLSYAAASAEHFARGAISILNATNVVANLCFGSECGELLPLENVANALTYESEKYKKMLHEQLNLGLVFPKARQNALQQTHENINCELLEKPNNILAIEYLKAINQTKSNVKPFTIKREIAGYHDTQIYENIASATAIRQAIETENLQQAENSLQVKKLLQVKNSLQVKKSMPENCYDLLSNELEKVTSVANLNNLSLILHYLISQKGASWLETICGVNEGLENRIFKLSNENYTIDEIISQLKTKRYTFTKINRILLHCILNLTKNDFNEYEQNRGVQYVRVLGFRKNSEHLLKEISNNCTLPLIMNLKNANQNLNPLAQKMLNQEIMSTDVYNLSVVSKTFKPKNYEYTQPLIII